MPKQSFKQKLSLGSATVLLLVILILASADFSIESMQAASSDNVSGWAWSENIGWISFNDINCDSDSNGFIDLVCGGDNVTDVVVPFGVAVDGVGDFSGFVWSENIGWIGFDAASVNGCPEGPPCQANVDPVTGVVTGWARACSVFPEGVCSGALRPPAERGNWQGWISLNCANTAVTCAVSNYEVSYNNATNEFEGWAWAGGNVSDDEASVGWISFNKLNCDTAPLPLPSGCPPGPLPDYKVSMLLGNPPVAQANCECPVSSTGCIAATCTAYAPNNSIFTSGMNLNANNSCDIEDCDRVAGGFCSPMPACGGADPCNLDCVWTEDSGAWSSVGCGDQLFAPGPGIFNVALTVTDPNGRDDTDNLTVNLLRDAWAKFECCYGDDKNLQTDCEPADWQDCTAIKFEIGTDKIWLRADRAGGGLSRESDGAAPLGELDYTWTFPVEAYFPIASPNDTSGAVVGWFYVVGLQADIILDIIDSAGRTDRIIQGLDSRFPMPAWYED